MLPPLLSHSIMFNVAISEQEYFSLSGLYPLKVDTIMLIAVTLTELRLYFLLTFLNRDKAIKIT